MDAVITPSHTGGTVSVPSSKSVSHRALICAALSENESVIHGITQSDDVCATMGALSALGAGFDVHNGTIRVTPIDRSKVNANTVIDCRESGSTLRFMLPIIASLGASCDLTCSGRLPSRPLSPLYEQLCGHGVSLSQNGVYPMCVGGRLKSGEYRLAGNVSSQYISGLMFALPMCEGNSEIVIEGALESESYINLTLSVLSKYGISVDRTERGYFVRGHQKYTAPRESFCEGDWSNAAFFMALGALGSNSVCCQGLSLDSVQGDRAIMNVLSRFGARIEKGQNSVTVHPSSLCGITVDASDIPDLVPIISVLGAFAKGKTRIVNAQRLRLKESDRLLAMREGLGVLGADISETDDGLVICGRESLSAGEVSGFGDHRIVMSLCVAAERANAEVIIRGAEAHNKSYPAFFDDFVSVGGDVFLKR